MTRIVPLGNLRPFSRDRTRDRLKLRDSAAAGPRRNRRTMRASAGVSEEGANLVSRFRGEDVLELASLLLDLGFAIHGEAVGKEALGQAMATNDTASAFASA